MRTCSQTKALFPPGFDKAASLRPPQLMFLAQMLPRLQKTPDPGLPRSGQMFDPWSLASLKGWHWKVFLGGCLSASSLPLPPPQPPKIPVLFHYETKRNVHCILVSRPALPFVNPPNTARSLAWHQRAKGVTRRKARVGKSRNERA